VSKANRIYMKERRALLKSLGICQVCGQKPCRDGRTTCEPCADRARVNRRNEERRWRPNLKALGMCIVCKTREAIPGMCMCGACQEARNERTKTYTAKKKAAGICTNCTRPNEGFDRCPRCRALNAEYKRRARERKARKRAA
jgi:hypothetical protein